MGPAVKWWETVNTQVKHIVLQKIMTAAQNRSWERRKGECYNFI